MVTEAPVVGAAEGDCALALSTINAAPIARKKTIAVALNFIFPLTILGEEKIALTWWLNRRTLTAGRDAASRLSRKTGEVISPAGRPCRADT